MNENIPEETISSTAQKVKELRNQERSHTWLQRYYRPICNAAKIESVPTWDINGKFYQGEQTLQKLADLSGYQGDRNFLYMLPDH